VSKRIEKLLRKALIQEGPMAYALYEHELVDHLDYWYNGLVLQRNVGDFRPYLVGSLNFEPLYLVVKTRTLRCNISITAQC
jgi:hypothetical protein